MERVPTAELKAMVVSLFASVVPGRSSSEDIARLQTIGHACRELYFRDGSAAYDWAAALSPDTLSAQACNAILSVAARQEPALAVELAQLYSEKHGQGFMSTLAGNLLTGFMERGDMAGIASLVSRNDLGNIYCPNISYPAGFDFPGLLRALDGKVGTSGPMARWALRDPDAAWDYIALHHPSGKAFPSSEGNLFHNVFHASILRDGAEKGVAWTMERISTLSPEQRTAFLGDLNLDRMELPSDAVASLLGGLPAADRQTVVSGMRSDSFSSGRTLQKYLSILDVLPREEMLGELTGIYQIHRGTLESTDEEDSDGETTGSSNSRIRRGFSDAEQRFNLTTDELARIRGDDRR